MQLIINGVCVCVCTVHRESREFLARGSRRGDQRFRRVPVCSGPKFHGHGAKLENGNDSTAVDHGALIILDIDIVQRSTGTRHDYYT